MAKAKDDHDHHSRSRIYADPLAAAIAPPPDESPEERTRRVQAESDAKRHSERIDELLQLEKMEKKKARAEVNVLLLGQSESGKSTTLKREFSLPRPSSHLDRAAVVRSLGFFIFYFPFPYFSCYLSSPSGTR